MIKSQYHRRLKPNFDPDEMPITIYLSVTIVRKLNELKAFYENENIKHFPDWLTNINGEYLTNLQLEEMRNVDYESIIGYDINDVIENLHKELIGKGENKDV